MQKTDNSMSFTTKTTAKNLRKPTNVANKKNAMKQKVRHEISQVFH